MRCEVAKVVCLQTRARMAKRRVCFGVVLTPLSAPMGNPSHIG